MMTPIFQNNWDKPPRNGREFIYNGAKYVVKSSIKEGFSNSFQIVVLDEQRNEYSFKMCDFWNIFVPVELEEGDNVIAFCNGMPYETGICFKSTSFETSDRDIPSVRIRTAKYGAEFAIICQPNEIGEFLVSSVDKHSNNFPPANWFFKMPRMEQRIRFNEAKSNIKEAMIQIDWSDIHSEDVNTFIADGKHLLQTVEDFISKYQTK